MRIVKEHDERKKEILDAASKLFATKGYEKCTINDILKEVNIAKGTFYYYFKSKEEVMDEIVARFTEKAFASAKAVIEKVDLEPEDKLLQIFLAMRIKDEQSEEILDELHKPENALMHQKTLNDLVTVMAPLLAQVIEEGNQKGIWKCKYPLQYMQIFLAATTLTDEGMFEISSEEQTKILTALISILENMLSVKEGTYEKKLLEYWNNNDNNSICFRK